jgi:benzoate membrane transport protein
VLRDFNAAAFWAGITVFLWYVFGALPLQIAVLGRLGVGQAQASSWIFITWFSCAVATVVMSIYYRQPIPINWTIPGLVYLGTLAGQFSIGEMAAANLVAGLAIIVLGLLGVGGRILQWIPLPIVMGMFAGSSLEYLTRLVSATVQDLAIAGTTVLGYLLGRLIGNPRLPPVGLAVILGAIAVVLLRGADPGPLVFELPSLVVPDLTFSPQAILAITLPMIVLSMVVGNIQGLGFLVAQGYRVPANVITVVVGISSVINALLSGHPAIVGRTGVAIVASSEAGPLPGRYWGNLVAAPLIVGVALSAGLATSLLAILPAPYVLALAGLAIFTALQDAFEKAFGVELRFGALVAFAVAATPFSIVGITSAFWAVLAGLAASAIAERDGLKTYWSRPAI